MFDYQTVKLLHHHTNDDWSPMAETDHDPAARDPERAWLRGARIFKCTKCDEQIAIAPPDSHPADLGA